MALHRTSRVFAVFGSADSETIPLAAHLGSEIVKGEEVLLTGGTGSLNLSRKERLTVKERAIAGADNVRLGGKAARWIGVLRGEKALGYSLDRAGEAFKIETDLSHKRNCLEACLCDAAVALDGGDGTVSEAVFCLSLRKPVVFVGDSWKAYRVHEASGSIDSDGMVSAAFKRVGNILAADAPLHQIFDRKNVLACVSSGVYNWFGTPMSAEGAAAVVADSLEWLRSVSSISGDFPAIARYATVISAYNSWL